MARFQLPGGQAQPSLVRLAASTQQAGAAYQERPARVHLAWDALKPLEKRNKGRG